MRHVLIYGKQPSYDKYKYKEDENMKIDFNNMLQTSIGEHGIREQDIQKMAQKKLQP